MNSNTIRTLRKEYMRGELTKRSVSPSPFLQFNLWFTEANASDLPEPNAMTLATVNSDGLPSVRMVLLKEWNELGFVFFTHYESKKGQHLALNPHVALLFFWPELERQIRITGRAEKVSEDVSDRYFAARPRGSQVSATISPQSSIIASRDELESLRAATEKRFENQEILRPENWGGYRVVPTTFEFWQGREDRLHDRILYEEASNRWKICRLAP